MSLRPLKSEVYSRQILTYKGGPHSKGYVQCDLAEPVDETGAWIVRARQTLTLTTLNYFCKNHEDQRVFSI